MSYFKEVGLRSIRFTFVCTEIERTMLAALSQQLQRSQGDVVRCLIREAVIVNGCKIDIDEPPVSSNNLQEAIYKTK
jgi:hypothetical protein